METLKHSENSCQHPDTPSSRPQHKEGQIPGSLTELRKEMTSWTAERSPDSTFITLTGQCVCARKRVCIGALLTQVAIDELAVVHLAPHGADLL